MSNYDSDSEVSRDVEEQAEEIERLTAVDFLVDERLSPTDPYENAIHGHLSEGENDREKVASWNLKRIRLALGLSQQQVSDKLAEAPGRTRLSQSQLAKMERGERPWRLNEAFDLAEALGVDYFEFWRGQHFTDDRELQILAARLGWQAKIDHADRIRETWEEAYREALKAGWKLVHTAAYLGIEDEAALGLLAITARHEARVARVLEELDDPSLTSEELAKIRADNKVRETQRKESQEWARVELARLTAELAEKRTKKNEQGSKRS